MKLTRQRITFLAFLGVGIVALIADRLLFQPAGASAASSADAYAVAPGSSGPGLEGAEAEAAPKKGGRDPEPDASRRPLADRLASTSWTPKVHDAFRADESWIAAPAAEAAAAQPQEPAFSIATWSAAHPLRSIMALASETDSVAAEPNPGAPAPSRRICAKLGTQIVEAGAVVAGCRVMMIEPNSVWLEREGKVYEVRLAPPADDRLRLRPRPMGERPPE
jgi:hypothetical protein